MTAPERREQIATNLAEVEDRIKAACLAAGRDRREITLIAVTKTFPASDIGHLVHLGVRDVGENRVQEALGKMERVDVPVQWHLIGHLQRNKARSLENFALLHSLDSARLADAVSAAGVSRARAVEALVQVNVSGEANKNGCRLEEAPALVDDLAALGLDVCGLMAVGPAGPPEGARLGFRRVVALADRLGLRERSMGMTDDLEVAVQEGTTMVRIGRALFGPRPGRVDRQR